MKRYWALRLPCRPYIRIQVQFHLDIFGAAQFSAEKLGKTLRQRFKSALSWLDRFVRFSVHEIRPWLHSLSSWRFDSLIKTNDAKHARRFEAHQTLSIAFDHDETSSGSAVLELDFSSELASNWQWRCGVVSVVT